MNKTQICDVFTKFEKSNITFGPIIWGDLQVNVREFSVKLKGTFSQSVMNELCQWTVDITKRSNVNL